MTIGNRIFAALLLATAVFHASPASADKNPFEPKDPGRLEKELSDLASAAKDGPNGFCKLLFVPVQDVKAVRKNIETIDLKEFAKNTVESGQEEALDLPIGSFEKSERDLLSGKETEDDFTEDLRYHINSKSRTAWELSLIPREAHRRVGLLSDFILNSLGVMDTRRVPAWLERSVKKFKTSEVENALQEVAENLKKFEYEDPKALTSKLTHVELGVLCAQYGLLSVGDCVKSLNHILGLMKPYHAQVRFGELAAQAIVTMPEYIANFLGDWTNHEALRRAAEKMWGWVAKKDHVPNTNFFDLVASEYRALGLPEAEVIDRTWRFMSIYSTRGANIGPTIAAFTPPGGDSVPIAGIFAILAHGTGILDARGLRLKQPMFSYPKGVRSTVDNSKPYHFWLSAYLARVSGGAVKNPEAGKDAAWIAQLGYQMKSMTNGRDPNRAFVVDPYDAANNKIRLDLTYAAAGAHYGKNSLEKKPKEVIYDIDAGFKHLLLAGDPLKPVTADEAVKLWDGLGRDGYFRWRRIFNPDAVLDFFKNAE
jgi:hypothetical protein